MPFKMQAWQSKVVFSAWCLLPMFGAPEKKKTQCVIKRSFSYYPLLKAVNWNTAIIHRSQSAETTVPVDHVNHPASVFSTLQENLATDGLWTAKGFSLHANFSEKKT